MRVLITGATGFIGSELSETLIKNNIDVYYLSTSKEKIINKPNFTGFYWNPSSEEIDLKCIEGVTYIINLAGKSIGCRWNSKNKKEILKSRVDSSKLLYKLLAENKHNVKKVISASAIGIYTNDFKKIQSEEIKKYNSDFLGQICKVWEDENQKFNELGIDTMIIRFGLVLAKNNGALPQFEKNIKNYLGGLLGTGEQWYSWIHIDDLIEIVNFGISNDFSGIFNGVAPKPVKQKDFLIALSKVLDQKLYFPRIPTFILRLILGEMHHLITDSQRVSADKLLNSDFKFKFLTIKEALSDLYKKNP